MSGTDSEKEANDMFLKPRKLCLKLACLLLSGLPIISAKHLIPGESIKVLGTKWIAKNYTFSFDGVEVPNDIISTKRMVLSFIAQLFDPLAS